MVRSVDQRTVSVKVTRILLEVRRSNGPPAQLYETGGQASLHIEILVIGFYSTLAKTTLLGRIKLADEIGTKSSNSKVVHIWIYDNFLLSFYLLFRYCNLAILNLLVHAQVHLCISSASFHFHQSFSFLLQCCYKIDTHYLKLAYPCIVISSVKRYDAIFATLSQFILTLEVQLCQVLDLFSVENDKARECEMCS